MPVVVSTLTDSVEYADHHTDAAGGVAELRHSVVVKGGANLAQKKLLLLEEGESSVAGVTTEVSDEQADFLEKHPLFQLHEKNGFVKIVKSKPNAAKVAKDMESHDKATQLTDADTDDKNPNARLKGHKIKASKAE